LVGLLKVVMLASVTKHTNRNIVDGKTLFVLNAQTTSSNWRCYVVAKSTDELFAQQCQCGEGTWADTIKILASPA